MIVTGIVRLFQLIFSVIVLGLAISSVRWQVYGSVPSNGYASFAGAWGVFTALLGLAALFISSFPGLIMAAIDALAFIILLAAGIAYAVQVRGVNCNNWGDDVPSNPVYYNVMNGGLIDNDRGEIEYIGVPFSSDGSPNLSVLKGRCQTVIADDVFIFLACIVSLVAAVLAFTAHRRGGGRSAAV